MTREALEPEQPEPPLPAEVERSLDRTACPAHCWHGLVLGQTEEEVVSALRGDPTTNTAVDFQDGDYLRIQHHRDNGRTSIDWFFNYNEHGATMLNADGRLNHIVVPLESTLPLQNFLDRLGPPELVNLTSLERGFTITGMWLYYLERGLGLEVRLVGQPPALAGESPVRRVSFFDAAGANEYHCTSGLMRWGGLAELVRYGAPQNSDILVRILPPDCPSLVPTLVGK